MVGKSGERTPLSPSRSLTQMSYSIPENFCATSDAPCRLFIGGLLKEAWNLAEESVGNSSLGSVMLNSGLKKQGVPDRVVQCGKEVKTQMTKKELLEENEELRNAMSEIRGRLDEVLGEEIEEDVEEEND